MALAIPLALRLFFKQHPPSASNFRSIQKCLEVIEIRFPKELGLSSHKPNIGLALWATTQLPGIDDWIINELASLKSALGLPGSLSDQLPRLILVEYG